MTSSRMSAAGRATLAQREGCRLAAYHDSVGVPTIGVGHTGRASPPAVRMGMTITAAEADVIFARDLAPFEDAVDKAVRVPLTTNQRDACISLAFNIGAAGFAGSTVVHKLNAGDVRGAADAFLMWERPAVLAGRRRSERVQFLTPDAPIVAALQPAASAAPATVPHAQAAPVSTVTRPTFWGWLFSRKAA